MAGPLSAIFANTGAVNEGNVGTVTFSNIIGGVGPYTYSYDFDNNGVFEIAGSSRHGLPFPPQYLNPVSQTIHARVTDRPVHFSDYTTIITVNNLPPAVTARSTGQPASRGLSTNFGLGSFADPGVNDGPWTVASQLGRQFHVDLTASTLGTLARPTLSRLTALGQPLSP